MKNYLILLLCICFTSEITAQSVSVDSSKYPRLVTFTAQQDQAQMMQQLGIKKLRPGPSGNASAPNHANYDEAIANPCPLLPDALITKKGKKVTNAEILKLKCMAEFHQKHQTLHGLQKSPIMNLLDAFLLLQNN